MSDFVFDPTKSYGAVCHCTDKVAGDEDARMLLEGIAHERIPEEYWPKIRYGVMTESHLDKDGNVTDKPGCTIWWLYRQRDFDCLILNDDWPIRIEVEP